MMKDCPVCGIARPADSPEGNCPTCLMRLGLDGKLRGEIDERLFGTVTDLGRGDHNDVDGDDGEPIDPEGRLLLGAEIARGGSGVIFTGRDTDLDRQVAVKVLQERHRDRPDMIRRFLAEARTAGQLQHPGIAPIHELGRLSDGRPFFSMKLVQGQTLAEVLAKRGKSASETSRLLTIFLRVAETIAYVHRKGIVHRDIKPANIMVGAFGEVQVMDWGLAVPVAAVSEPELPDAVMSRMTGHLPAADREGERICNPAAATPASPVGFPSENGDASIAAADRFTTLDTRHRNRRVAGTPAYMAPEQFLNGGCSVDERADVFALGAVLFEILTGEVLFGRTSLSLSGVGDPPHEERGVFSPLDEPGVDAELAALVRECVAADKAMRPRDAGVVAGRISAHLALIQERMHQADLLRVEAQMRAEAERKRRRLTAVIGVLTSALLVAAFAGYVQWQNRRASADAVVREVDSLLRTASGSTAEDPLLWQSARDAATRAESMLQNGPARQRNALREISARIDAGLTAAQRDARLLAELEFARMRADDFDFIGAVQSFAAAFAKAGLDVERDPSAAGRMIASKPVEVRSAIISALDAWSMMVSRTMPLPGSKPRPWEAPRAAARAADSDPWRNHIRDVLDGRKSSALMQAALAKRTDEQPPQSLAFAGETLFWTGHAKQAVALLERAQSQHPNDFWFNQDLSRMLQFEPSQPHLALTYATAAAALRPNSPSAHISRAAALEMLHRLDDAEAEYRQVIRIRPDYGPVYGRLAMLLSYGAGRYEDSVEIFRTAQRLQPDRSSSSRILLSDVLEKLRRYEEASAEVEPNTREDPSDVSSWVQLAREQLLARHRESAVDAIAIAAKAIPPKNPEPGELLAVRSMLVLYDKLAGVQAGTAVPADRTERLKLAELAGRIGYAAAAVRLYSEGEDPSAALPFEAAVFAAYAGTKPTLDDPAPNEAERARLRQLSFDWFRAQLNRYKATLAQRPDDRELIGLTVGTWLNQADLDGARSPDLLNSLPPEERLAWQKLWNDVRALNITSAD